MNPVEAVKIDIQRLHETWMEFFFPRQLNTGNVMGKWKPSTFPEKITYFGWASLGFPFLLFLYPLLILGFGLRFNVRKIDSAGTRLGVVGVVALSVLIWSALSAVAHIRFSYNGFIAVVAASGVATLSATLALLTTRTGGRGLTIATAYPFAMTALFLPPVVAALYSPTLASTVFPESTSLATWILDNILYIGGVNKLVRDTFTLTGISYVGMWFSLAVPLGWFIGLTVALADVVRPSSD